MQTSCTNISISYYVDPRWVKLNMHLTCILGINCRWAI